MGSPDIRRISHLVFVEGVPLRPVKLELQDLSPTTDVRMRCTITGTTARVFARLRLTQN